MLIAFFFVVFKKICFKSNDVDFDYHTDSDSDIEVEMYNGYPITTADSANRTEPRFVSLESPFSNPDPKLLKRNICYGYLCAKDIARNFNEAVYASHLIHTPRVSNGIHAFADDDVEDKFGVGRDNILKLTNAARAKTDAIVFYIDFGMTQGMKFAEMFAKARGIPCEYRRLPNEMLKECTESVVTDKIEEVVKVETTETENAHTDGAIEEVEDMES
jgi:hypothetical protein